MVDCFYADYFRTRAAEKGAVGFKEVFRRIAAFLDADAEFPAHFKYRCAGDTG